MQRITFLTIYIFLVGSINDLPCPSPQYIKLGMRGFVQCSFQEPFYGIFWYHSANVPDEQPFLYSINFVKGGIGFSSGQYNIHPNGSMTINNVDLTHDKIFRVAVLNTSYAAPVTFDVRVVVYVKPSKSYPIINHCGSERVCYKSSDNLTEFICSVSDTRPPVELAWFLRNFHGDDKISFEQTTTGTDQILSSTFIKTNPEFPNSLSRSCLFVCKAIIPQELYPFQESLILVDQFSQDLSKIERITLYVETGTKMKLKCGDDQTVYVIWKMLAASGQWKTIIHFPEKDDTNMRAQSVGYYLVDKGSLIVCNIEAQHEGGYICIYGDGTREDFKAYNVSSYVLPDPPFPVVQGCSHSQLCVLMVNRTGSLKCTVTKILPKVQLDWREVSTSSSSSISFLRQKLITRNSGRTFDISLTADYIVTDQHAENLTVECSITGWKGYDLKHTTQLVLTFMSMHTSVTSPEVKLDDDNPWILENLVWIVPTSVCGMAFLILTLSLACRNRSRSIQIKAGEEYPMMETTTMKHLSTDMMLFIEQLKAHYELLCAMIQPLPCLRDQQYSVSSVFVDSGIEVLSSNATDKNKGRHWKRLKSYKDIVDENRCPSKRIFVEGESGYGKSVLALQLASDWCDGSEENPVKNFDVFLLFLMRQLTGVRSIYRAIQQLLLPKESKFTEENIQEFLGCCSSVLFVFDGFDEYSVNEEMESSSDIRNIISGEMYPKFKVILLTRKSCIPSIYSPKTVWARMNGFNRESQEKYIEKAASGIRRNVIEELTGNLNSSPVIKDTFETPLFFVTFVHLTQISRSIEKVTSVTTFFQYVMNCFQAHIQRKGEPNLYAKMPQYEQAVGKFAFYSLLGNAKKFTWSENEVLEKIENDTFDCLLRMGIFVTEEVQSNLEELGPSALIERPYRKEVRFFNKFFCEWFAALYLAKHVRPLFSIYKRDIAKKLDPFDFQYLYRFACGLDVQAAEIINFQLLGDDHLRFKILCMLEQTRMNELSRDIVQNIVSASITFKEDDSKLLQVSTIQLLEIASKNKISVPGAHVQAVCKSFSMVKGGIVLNSGFIIPTLTTLKELRISRLGREVTSQEVLESFRYALQCAKLETLSLEDCLLPLSFNGNRVLRELQAKRLKVRWVPIYSPYILNIQTGLWESGHDLTRLTHRKYKDLVGNFKSEYPDVEKQHL